MTTTAEGIETEAQLSNDPRAGLHRDAGISAQRALAGTAVGELLSRFGNAGTGNADAIQRRSLAL